jgi:hypothetical protein
MENVNAAQILREKQKGNLKASRRKSNINEDEAVKLIHELEVHQIEMQNEELCRQSSKRNTTKNIMHYMIFAIWLL